MYQILIMDSQRTNRLKIRHYLDDFNADFKIIGELANTEQAQRYLKTKQVDLIIGDDTFTNPTAIDLFNEYREDKPGLHMILFTDNLMFSQSKQTLANGRLEYLQKPVRKSEVLTSLRRMSNFMDAAQIKAAKIVDLKYSYDENLHHFRERFLMNLIYGSLRKNDHILKQLDYFKIPHGQSFAVAIFKIDDYRRYELALTEDEKNFMIYKIFHHIEAFLGTEGIAFISRYDEITLFFTSMTQKMDIIDLCNKLLDSIHDVLEISGTIGIGQNYSDLSKVHLSYNQAVDAVLEHDYLGRDTVIHIDYVAGKNDLTYAYGPEQEITLVKYALSGQTSESLKTLKKVLTAISTKKDYSSGFYTAFIKKLLYHLYRDALTYDYQIKDLLEPSLNFQEIEAITSAPSAYDYMAKVIQTITDYVSEQKINQDQELLKNTLKYVQAYYTSRISLSSAAQYLMTTPKHLEDIIFRVYEKTFYDFCMMVRIENAKEMLLNSRKNTTEISSSVGFNNTEYFTAIFKKYTNMTPSEYKHQNKDTSNKPITLEKTRSIPFFPRRLR